MAKAPNLLRKVSIDGKWKMLPVCRFPAAGARFPAAGARFPAAGAHHKIPGGEPKFDLTRVMHAGVPVVAATGTFYLEYREKGRRVRRAIGDDHREVKAALATQASVIDLRAKGVATEDAPQLRPRSTPASEGKTIRAVVDAFTHSPPVGYRRSSYLKYRNAIESFAACTQKKYVGELGREDVLKFLSWVVHHQGLDVSTAIDKARDARKILRDHGAAIDMKKGDWPKVTELQPEIYKPQALKALFAAADEEEYCLFQTFLLSGMREQEVAHLHWSDFDRDASTLSVSKKPGFNPKNYEERTVPIPRKLVKLLEEQRKRQAGAHALLFPTSKRNANRGAPGGQPDNHLIRRLKKLAYRAGLNCGRCVRVQRGRTVVCAAAAVCGEFWLHKFRHTYATTLLRDGVDLLSVQKLLGHKDLDSTRRYLRALEPEDLLKKINSTSLATRFI